jgi:flagellar basal body rod protein FlgF
MASTYVNDLRLNEMATGDQSGSWGTVTNTNLELIAEAFSYGTEAITTNADTHTTTIADGGTDPGRSMFLKYTGTLDSACTITIGPNTVSKLWFIENATSGSQNIIIKQGSGATVTIASGKTKAIYSDGVGSGAKMVDAFDSLSVGALASAGAVSGTTGTFSGAVAGASATFDGGVDIDNINIDGTTIALSSGDLTLDVAGDITLDADGGDIFLKNAGTTFATFTDNSGHLDIFVPQTNGDILFKGNDGGSTITALTLDMSAAGSATFNDAVKLGDGSVLSLGVGNDLEIYSDGTNGQIAAQNGNLTLDVAGDITLDAGGTDIYLKTQGTSWGHFMTTSNNFYINSTITDGDIIFQGVDGGSGITALTLDMSAAGAATFNGAITSGGNITVGGTNNLIVNDNGVAIFGNDGDLSIGNSGTIGLISAPNGDITLDTAGNINLDADGGNIRIKDGGTEYGTINKNGTANLSIYSSASDADMLFQGNDGGSVITALTLDMSAAGAATFNNDVTAFSDERLKSNITTIPDALSKVTEMRGVHYVRDATGKDSTGVIAQEMQKVAPELVLTADDEMGTLSVNYGNITGYLIEAIKELKAEIEELKAR